MSIEIHQLSRIYEAKGRRVAALQDVCLRIEDGECVAIVGGSGSGKTTLLNCLSGMDQPTDGNILLDGKDITRLSQDELAVLRRRKIGVVYQFFNLIPELNLADNITLPLELDGEAPDPERLSWVLAAVGLAGREYDFPSALSGGQQQRAALARTLYASPSLILADEPTGNLDEENAREVLELLLRMNKEQGTTLIVVTHSKEVAARAARCIRIEDGRVVADEKREA